MTREIFRQDKPNTAASGELQRGGRDLPHEPVGQASFARELRAMGQALEKLKLTSFELELRDGVYRVCGSTRGDKAGVRSWAQSLRGLLRRGGATRPIEVSYSRTELENLDRQESAKRRDGENFPDPNSISQILRGIGTFLDARSVRSLTAIALEERAVTVLYRNRDGYPVRQIHDMDFFYDYGIKLYLHRSNRPKNAMPDEPTLYVQW